MPQNYKALTRTYRPQNFEDIVSQEHVSNTLKNAIKQDRLSHAYMFCGPRGVGKTTMARVLARTINSIDAGVDAESLNQTLNVVEIDAASNNKVDDVHHLRESVRIPPQNGRYKVFIIDEVHMLSKAAFNALLKTLEEPPAHAIFIFATTEPHKVLPTILSRVQRFDFKRISVDEIVARLKVICKNEDISIDEESLHVIAKKADGALRDALGLMDQAIAFCGSDIRYQELIRALNVVGVDQLFQFTEAIENKDADAGLRLVNNLLQDGVDIQEFLSALTEHIRNLYVALHSERMFLVDATPETKERYRESSKAFDEEDLMRMLHLASEVQIKIKEVQQPRVHFEILLLKLVHMNRSRQLNQLINEIHQLKKKNWNQVSNGSKPEEQKKPSQQSEFSPKPDQNRQNNGNGSQPETPIAREEPDSDSEEGSYQDASEDPKPQEDSNSFAAGKPASAEESTENEDDFLLVKPTLGYAKGISSSNGVETQIAEKTDTSDSSKPKETVQVNSVADIEKYWSQIIEVVKQQAPQVLYFQMDRVRLKDLKGNQLIVTTDTEFANNLFDENQELISSLMKQVTGSRIRVKCIVERNKKKKETLSPYERFKELQKKDPHLKAVVELFGAELDY